MSLQNFEQVNGRTQLNIGGNIIKQFMADEIFTRPNLKPFVFITETGGGKTFTACDIIRVCAESGFNQINYITSTFNSGENKYARDQILNACVIQKNQIESLIQIIDEAKNSQKENYIDQLKITAENAMSQLERDETTRYKQSVINKMNNSKYTFEFLSKRVFGGDMKATEILKYIFYSSDSPNSYKRNVESNKNELESILSSGISDLLNIEGEEKTKLFILNDWCQQIYKLFNKYDQDYVMICKEILRGKIKQIIYGNPNMLLDYQMNGKSPNKDLDNYLQLIMDPRRLCLIIDDITHILANAGTRGSKVMCDGKEMSEKDAFMSVFNQIFTQGRHLGTIMLGIHQIQNIASNISSLISNVIINPGTNLGMSKNLFIMKNKKDIQLILDAIREYNSTNKTFFNLICYNDVSQSPDSNSQYVLYQAKAQTSEVFNLGIYKNAPYFYELGKQQMRKLYSTEAEQLIDEAEKYQPKIQKEESYKEESYEEDCEDDYEEDEYSED